MKNKTETRGVIFRIIASFFLLLFFLINNVSIRKYQIIKETFPKTHCYFIDNPLLFHCFFYCYSIDILLLFQACFRVINRVVFGNS